VPRRHPFPFFYPGLALTALASPCIGGSRLAIGIPPEELLPRMSELEETV